MRPDDAAQLCPACPAAIALVSEFVPVVVCEGCATPFLWRLPATTSRPPWRPRNAPRDLATLARWLPELGARSPTLLRTASWTAGPGAHALEGRPDWIDGNTSFGDAVACWRWLRALIAAGHGDAVAQLWGAYGLSGDGDVHEAARRHRDSMLGVALGCAPGPLREAWRTAARETQQRRLLVLRRDRPGTVDATSGARVFDERPGPAVHHLVLRGTTGPSVPAQAALWGTERLGPLWHPAPVPRETARALALGWAPAAERERWRGLSSRALRDAEAVAWGELTLRRAGEVYAGA